MSEPDLTERLRLYLDADTAGPEAHAHFTRIQLALVAGAQLVEPGDLIGPGEAAVILGKDRTTISRWIREGYMPTPLQNLMIRGGSGVPIWTRATIEAFRHRHAVHADGAGRRPLGTRA
jgi:hypothetical protein